MYAAPTADGPGGVAYQGAVAVHRQGSGHAVWWPRQRPDTITQSAVDRDVGMLGL